MKTETVTQHNNSNCCNSIKKRNTIFLCSLTHHFPIPNDSESFLRSSGSLNYYITVSSDVALRER